MVPKAVAIALAVATLVAACSSDDDGEPRGIAWRGDDPVVVVDRTASGVEFVAADDAGDDTDSAQEISLPIGVRGTLDGEADIDTFRLEVDEGMHLSALVTGAEDIDLVLDVLDASGDRIVRSDRAPTGYSEGVPNLWLEPGTYFLQVLEFVRGERGGEGGRQGPSEPYELVVQRYEHESGFEKEPNDELERATPVDIGQDMFGYIGWHRDRDVWRVPLDGALPTDGFRIAISGVPWVTPELEILGPDGEVVLTREGERGEPLYLHNLSPEHAFGGEERDVGAFYVAISSGRSNPEEPYRLRVRRRDMEPDSELEPNHEPSLATPLREDGGEREGRRRGHLDVGDVDMYRLSSSPGVRQLHAAVEPTSQMVAHLEVRIEGEEADSAQADAAGQRASVTGLEVPAGKEVVLVVSGQARDPRGAPYELRWSVH